MKTLLCPYCNEEFPTGQPGHICKDIKNEDDRKLMKGCTIILLPREEPSDK